MMKRSAMVVVLLLTAAVVREGYGQVDFVVNARPASILIDTSGSKFSAEGPDGRVSMSQVYTMPNISLGAGIEIGDAYLDVTGGGGIVINDNFRSFLLQASAALNFTLSESLIAGPRLGLVYFPDPEWTENEDVKFDESLGFLAGVQLAMGDKIQYLVSVDLINMSLDADSGTGVETSEDKLDISGIAFQFGVRGEF